MRPEDIELSRRYTDILRVRGNAERTIDNYIYAVRGFAQFLGERPLSSATADDIIAHQLAIKASGRSDSCVRVATYAFARVSRAGVGTRRCEAREVAAAARAEATAGGPELR